MKFKLFLAALALLATTAFAQVTQTIIAPNSALPGSCTTAQLPTWLDSAGTFYTCKGGTPTAVGGSGTFNALSGDATSTATGGATTVIQVEGGAIPVSGAVIGTNSSKQLVAATAHGIETPLVCADTSASGTVQVCSTSPTFTPASGDCVIYTTTTANTGAGLTLNVNSLGAKSVAKWLGTTTLAAGDVPVTEPQLACYNGTVWNLSTIGNAPTGGGGGVTSVSFTGGLISVATATTTPALTVAGTSGGIPYFSAASTWASSGALPSGDFVLGGGAGSAPTATFSIVTAAKGGTGVANTATLTLGSSNQNWATLGTGIVKNTTTTGAITDAASADVIGLWTGSCTSSTFLRGDGACASASGSTGISGGTANFIPVFGTSTTITGNSHIDDGSTTAGVLTATEPLVIVDSTDPNFIGFAANGVAPAVQTSQAGWGLGATLTTAGYYKMPDAPGSGFWTAANASGIVTNTFTAAPTGTVVGTSDSQTLTNKSIAGSEINSGLVASTVGGTGVNNTATLTLGSSSQNWATLGTGIVKNTTTTGAITDAASADVIGLWTGSCTSSTFLRGDGACAAASGGGLPTGTTGQMVYYASGGTTGTATSGMLVGVTSGALTGAGLGLGGIEFPAATHFVDNYPASAGAVSFGASCASGTTASCTIVNGGSLDPAGGIIWAGYSDGSNDGEFIKYGAATSTTITTLTRGYWGSVAATHGNTVPIQFITEAWVQSTSTAPFRIGLQNGATWYNPPSTASAGVTTGLAVNSALYALSNICLAGTGNNKNCIIYNNSTDLSYQNSSNNSGLAAGANALQYNIATQAISTTATLTALTNVLTPQMPNNGTTAAAGTGGVLSSRCHIIWNQATGGTVAFAVHLSAAATRLDVTEVDYDGAGGIPLSSYVQPNVTASGTGAAIGTVTPSAFGTTFFSDFTLTLNPGTTNNQIIQMYAETSSSSDTLTIEPGSGCEAWK